MYIYLEEVNYTKPSFPLRITKRDKNGASTDIFKIVKLTLVQEDQLDNSLTSMQVKIIGEGVQLEIKRGDNES